MHQRMEHNAIKHLVFFCSTYRMFFLKIYNSQFCKWKHVQSTMEREHTLNCRHTCAPSAWECNRNLSMFHGQREKTKPKERYTARKVNTSTQRKRPGTQTNIYNRQQIKSATHKKVNQPINLSLNSQLKRAKPLFSKNKPKTGNSFAAQGM